MSGSARLRNDRGGELAADAAAVGIGVISALEAPEAAMSPSASQTLMSAEGLRRPSLAHRTDGIVLALRALDTALEVIDAPVFISDSGGQIVHANTMGHRLLERDAGIVSASVANMASSGAVRTPWQWVPLPEQGECLGYLAILRSPPPEPAGNALSEATLRWNLTARQRDVLNLVALGLTNADVSGSLGIEVCTVEFHLSAIFDKAGVDNRTTLIARFLDF